MVISKKYCFYGWPSIFSDKFYIKIQSKSEIPVFIFLLFGIF